MENYLTIDKVKRTIIKEKLLEKDDKVLVGISGGPDSVCLLHILNNLKEYLNISIAAVHINHMLRGNEADQDMLYTQRLCIALGVQLFTEHIDINKMSNSLSISTEEAGRIARYETFNKILKENNYNKIAVAHNKNDNAETVIMNIIRGTGVDGLCGIEYKRDNIIRPLLDVEREEIENYCINNCLNPRIDSTNLEALYTRNKTRIKLIPYINEIYNADFTKSITSMSQLVRDDNDYIKNQAIKYLNSCCNKENNEYKIDIIKFNSYHNAIKKRIIRLILNELLKGYLRGFEKKHIDNIIEFAQKGNTGKLIEFPHNIIVTKQYMYLLISFKNNNKNIKFNYKINIPGKTYINENSSIINAQIITNTNNEVYTKKIEKGYIQIFDYDKLKSGIIIRCREEGDVFYPYNAPGQKKLKEYFINNKIPKPKRDIIPLIAIDKDIIWIIGERTSQKYIPNSTTKEILKLTYHQDK